jgi:Peptidase family M48
VLGFGVKSQQLVLVDDLIPKGEIPRDIVSPAYLSYEEALNDNLVDEDKRLAKKSKDKFILNSSYYINDLLVSGDIVFNDTITVYLNKIKDLILKDYPDIKDQIRVYTYKSPMVNALATNEGVVFVTTGLIARLNSEAQLAYILSHEISHFVKKHPINAYVEKIDLSKKDKSFKKLSGSNKFKLLAQKSRETEMEADTYGYNFYHKTSYNVNAPEQAFHILDQANMPYQVNGELTTKSFYDIENKINDSIFSTTNFSNTIELGLNKGEEDVLFSSHPAIDERLKNAKNKIGDRKGGSEFLISEAWFNYCKNTSRTVNVTQLLNLGMYSEAFHYCYLLEKEFGEQNFLMKLKLRTLYELAKVKNKSKQIDKDLLGFEIKEIDDRDAYLIAYIHAIKYEKNNKVSKYSKEVKSDILKELKLLSNTDLDNIMYKDIYDEIIKLSSESTEVEKREGYNFSYLTRPYKFANKGRKEYYKHYWKTGKPIKNLIVIDPSWNAFDTRKGMHSINSEKQSIELDEALINNAKMNGLNMKLMSTNSLTKDDVKTFNDRVTLINYLASNMDDETDLVYYNIDEFDRIMEENGADHIALLSINSVLNKKGVMDYVASGLSMAVIIGMPYGIYTLAKKNYSSFLYFAVYNTKMDEINFLDFRELKVNTNSMIINSYYYEYFKLLGKSRKLRKLRK